MAGIGFNFPWRYVFTEDYPAGYDPEWADYVDWEITNVDLSTGTYTITFKGTNTSTDRYGSYYSLQWKGLNISHSEIYGGYVQVGPLDPGEFDYVEAVFSYTANIHEIWGRAYNPIYVLLGGPY